MEMIKGGAHQLAMIEISCGNGHGSPAGGKARQNVPQSGPGGGGNPLQQLPTAAIRRSNGRAGTFEQHRNPGSPCGGSSPFRMVPMGAGGEEAIKFPDVGGDPGGSMAPPQPCRRFTLRYGGQPIEPVGIQHQQSGKSLQGLPGMGCKGGGIHARSQ